MVKHKNKDRVMLELPFPCERDAKRALLRGAYRVAARALRGQTGHIGAALALEEMADRLCSYPVDDDGEETAIINLAVRS